MSTTARRAGIPASWRLARLFRSPARSSRRSTLRWWKRSCGGWAATDGLIDTHIHLDGLKEVDELLLEGRQAGVSDLIAMGLDAATSHRAVAMAESLPGVWAAVGHPPLNQSP